MVAAAICLAVVGASGRGFVLTQRGRSTEIGLEDVVTSFRAEQTGEPAAPVTAALPSQAHAVPADSSDQTSPSIRFGQPGQPGQSGQSGTLEVESPASAPQPYRTPGEGVYTYRATGGEQISLLGGKHDYPEQVHATVRHLGGCAWEFRNDVLREHTDILHLCSGPGALNQHSQTRSVEFFGTRDGNTFTCNPPASFHLVTDEPGATSVSMCADGDGGTSELTRTFVGLEETTVGSESLPAVHIDIKGKFDGSVTGTSHDIMWLSPQTGLIYRWERSVDSIAKSFGTQVRYTESATFILESVAPRA